MASNTKRIEALLTKFAPILGEGLKDERGNKYDFGKNTEAEQSKHLFWVTNRDDEDTLGGFVLGTVIVDLIRTDSYNIEYLGLHKDSIAARKRSVEEDGTIVYEWVEDEDLSKPQREMKAKLQKYMKLQEQRITRAKEAELGV